MGTTRNKQALTRWAMVGTGLMADLIVPDFMLTTNLHLVAICSRSRRTGVRRLADWGVSAEVYDDLDELCANPGIDVVYIATPHSEHYWQAMMAIEAGKSVVVEKSFTMNLAEAESLVQAARDRGVFLMEAMWTRFDPLIREIQARVASGAIGEVTHVRAFFGVPIPFMPEHRLWNTELGGGSLLDQTVYAMTLADLFLGGQPAEIVARGDTAPNGADQDVSVMLTYKGGETALLASSLRTFLGLAAAVAGTEGRIDLGEPMWAPGSATIAIPDGRAAPKLESIEFTREGRGYVPMLRAVSEAVADGKLEAEAHPLSNTLRIMSLLDECRRQIMSVGHRDDQMPEVVPSRSTAGS
jgi:predicted dehydrogenase